MLTNTSRPRRFSDMVGQERPLAILRTILSQPTIPSTFIFAGQFGSGKTSAARILAAMVNCANPANQDACGECASCLEMANKTSDALVEIDAAVFGSAENIRTITDLIGLSTRHNYRVVVLDEAHSMSRQAFNALLKSMEEAPNNVLFVLVTTDLDKVPETVQSRALCFHFSPIHPVDIMDRLSVLAEQEKIDAEDDALQHLAQNSPSLRDAVKYLGLFAGRTLTLKDATALLGDPTLVKALLRDVLSKRDFEDSFTHVIEACTVPQVLETSLEVLTTLFRNQAITQVQYKMALDAVWGIVPIRSFDYRGKAVFRLALRTIQAVLTSETH